MWKRILAVLVVGSLGTAQADVLFVVEKGSIRKVQGTITKEVPGVSVCIRTPDGRELAFQASDVVNVLRSTEDTAPMVNTASQPPLLQGAQVPEVDRPARWILLYGYGGFGSQSLSDVNSAIQDDERIFQEAGAAVSFETFGGAPDFGCGMLVSLTKSVGLGFEFGYQGNSISNRYSDLTGSFSEAADLRILDVTANLEILIASAPGLHLGASAGVGFGRLKDEYHLRDFANYANVDGTGEWSGTGFVGGGYLGYRFQLAEIALMFLRSGYRFRNLGEFSGQSFSQYGSDSYSPQDNAGMPLDFDFSGFYVRAGIGFALGRKG